MSDAALKPCPLCSSPAVIVGWGHRGNGYGVRCDARNMESVRVCWLELRSVFDTEAEAIAAWNRRAERPVVVSDDTGRAHNLEKGIIAAIDFWANDNTVDAIGALHQALNSGPPLPLMFTPEHDKDLAYWQQHVEQTRRDALNSQEWPELDAEIERIKQVRGLVARAARPIALSYGVTCIACGSPETNCDCNEAGEP